MDRHRRTLARIDAVWCLVVPTPNVDDCIFGCRDSDRYRRIAESIYDPLKKALLSSSYASIKQVDLLNCGPHEGRTGPCGKRMRNTKALEAGYRRA